MNKKLKPWFIAAIICAGIELLITLCALFTSSSYELTFGWGTFLMFPRHSYPATAVIWCVCGFIGTAIEIRKDRPRALPIALSILPVLYVIPIVYMHVTYRPSSIMPGLSGLGIVFAWLNFGFPAIFMIVWDIVLIILRCRKNYDFHKSSDSRVCFTKRKGVYIAVVILCGLMPVFIALGVLGYDLYGQISYETENKNTNDEAMMYYNSADERIDYSNSGDMTEKLFDTPTRRSTALINYDEMRVSFIFQGYTYKDTLKTYLLEPMTFPPYQMYRASRKAVFRKYIGVPSMYLLCTKLYFFGDLTARIGTASTASTPFFNCRQDKSIFVTFGLQKSWQFVAFATKTMYNIV